MRKLEGLGKDITTAMDPRKMAQRMSNPFMNMLKTIGLIGLATRLPKILGAINRVETTVRGWASKVGELFGGDGKLNLDLDDKRTFLGKLRYALWNEDETGALNKLLENISQAFYNRKALADKLIGSPEWNGLQPGESIKHLIDWLGAFFGGAKGVIKAQNIEKEYKILDKNAKVGEALDRSLSGKEWSSVFNTGRNSDIYVSNLKSTSSSKGREDIKQSYLDWTKANNISDIYNSANKERFLKEKGREFLTDLGESDILTLRLHSAKRNGIGVDEGNHARPLTLTRRDLSIDGHRLAHDTRRASLACSLDIYWCLKGYLHYTELSESYASGGHTGVYTSVNNTTEYNTTSIDMELLFLLLKLLSTANDILVFKKFSDLFKIKGEVVRIKLVRHPMEERDRQFYNNPYTEFYEKIVLESVAGTPLELKETDFGNNQPPTKSWGVIRISSEQLQEIIQKIVGSNKIEDYTTTTQLKALNNLEQLGIVSNKTEKFGDLELSDRKYNTSQRINRTRDEGYNEAISYSKEVLRERRELQYRNATHYSSSAKYGPKAVSKYTSGEGNKGLAKLELTADQVKSNMDQIRDALRQEGFSDVQIAGIMGVIAHESGGTFDPRVVETLKGGKRGPGEGIVQWTSPERKEAFKKFWLNTLHPGESWPGIPFTSLEDQIKFFLHEFRQRKAYGMIKGLSNSQNSDAEILEKTVEYFTRGYENGGNNFLASKEGWYDVYHKYFEESMAERLPKASGILNTYFNRPVSESEINNSYGEIPIPSTRSGSSNQQATNSILSPTSGQDYSTLPTPQVIPSSSNFGAYFGQNASTAGKNVKAGSKNNKTNTSNGSKPKSVADAASVATAQEVAEVNANTKCSLQYQADLLNEAKAIRAELRSKGGGNSSPAKTNTKKQQP